MQKPLVSIIMPYFEQAEFLVDAVRSADAQTYTNVEIIIVDDASAVATAREMIEWRNMQRVRLIAHSENLGPGAARNTAIAKAQGDYLLPLDSDDLIAPEFVESALTTIIGSPDIAGVYSDVRLIGDAGGVRRPHCSLPELLFYRDSPNTFLCRRQVLESVGGYKAHVRAGEDVDLWVRLLSGGWTFAHIARPLYTYRKHAGALTAKDGFARLMTQMLLDEHRQLCQSHLDKIVAGRIEQYWEIVGKYTELYGSYSDLAGSGAGRQGVGR